jgi:NADPH:quinone reductase-like Zn-dependent oxidoreductase
MRAIIIENFGGSEQLKPADVPIPEPQANEVLIELAYTSVNPVDWKIREGLLQHVLPHHFPIILGWDAAGTVAGVGQSVTGFQPGEAVHAYCRKPAVQHGTYAAYVTMEEQAVAPMPRNLTFAQAAAIPLVGLTAWQALFDVMGLKAGQSVLVHAGAGGVGSMAIQFAKHAGATVYTTASERNYDYVKQLGADVAIDYTREPFAEVVKSKAPEGVDAVLDAVGGNTLQESYAVVKAGGVLVAITQPLDEAEAQAHDVKAGFMMVQPNGNQLREIGALIEAGEVKLPAIEEMDLNDAAIAQDRSQAQHVRGKIVLRIK